MYKAAPVTVFVQVYLTWSAGIICFVVAWVSTVYGLWQLIELHEIKGRRFNRYHELGQYALGNTPASAAYCPQCLLHLQAQSA